MDIEVIDQGEVTETVEAFPAFRDCQFTDGGQIDCDIEHAEYGWIPTTLDRVEGAAFFDLVVATGNVAQYAPPAPPSHDDQRAEALNHVDKVHAGFLRDLTGNATVEERDTWSIKESAARAIVGGSATEGQQSMLAYEAQGIGIEPLALAEIIIGKAEDFQALIGLAAGVKAKAKAAITQATGDQVPVEQVGPTLEQVFGQISAEIDAAIAQWKG